MTENDYIAEYIKERHPGDLSFDFAIWKVAKMVVEVGKEIVRIFQTTEVNQALSEKTESEELEMAKEEVTRGEIWDDLWDIREALWEADIPSPTVPEYVEHHEQIQSIMKLVEKKMEKYKREDSE